MMVKIDERPRRNTHQMVSTYQQEGEGYVGFGLGFACVAQRMPGYRLSRLEIRYASGTKEIPDVYKKPLPTSEFLSRYWNKSLVSILLQGAYEKSNCSIAVRWRDNVPYIQFVRANGTVQNLDKLVQKLELETVSCLVRNAPSSVPANSVDIDLTAEKTEGADRKETTSSSSPDKQEPPELVSPSAGQKLVTSSATLAPAAGGAKEQKNPAPANSEESRKTFSPAAKKSEPTCVSYDHPKAVRYTPETFDPCRDEWDSEIILLTPELAGHLLQFNTKNRKITKSNVDAIVAHIQTGQWRVTHQGIAFDANGVLVDGQHRLLAVMETGIPVPIVVTYGQTPGENQYIDVGRRRNEYDQLRINSDDFEWVDRSKQGPITNIIASVFPELQLRTAHDKGEWLKKHKELYLLVEEMFPSRHRRGASGPAVRAAALMVMAAGKRPSSPNFQRFCDAIKILTSGLIGDNFDPAANTMLQLRNKIEFDSKALGSGSVFNREVVYLTAWAIKQYIDGVNVKRFPTKVSNFSYPVINTDGFIVYDPASFNNTGPKKGKK